MVNFRGFFFEKADIPEVINQFSADFDWLFHKIGQLRGKRSTSDVYKAAYPNFAQSTSSLDLGVLVSLYSVLCNLFRN